MAPYIRDKRHLVGLIFVLIGLVLILDNIRFIPHFIPWWIWTWQFLLIAIGAFSLLTTDKTGPGIILIGIGSIFLLSDILPDFFNWFTNDNNMFWYLILILVGISLIVKRKRDHTAHAGRHSKRRGFGADASKDSGTSTFSNGDHDFFDEISIFGGGKKIITSENLKGGRITSIFGGMDLILTQAKLAEGIVEIEVFAMFGGWTLVVPPTWQVKSDVVAIFGGISDKRIFGPENVRDNTQQLVVKGIVMFGGGEIKSY